LTRWWEQCSLRRMVNILSDATKQQVIALSRLGWTLRHIEAATGVRRETASAYLKAAGLAVRPPGRWGHPPAKPAIGVSTDPGLPAAAAEPSPPGWEPRPQRAPTASACAPYRELIESAVALGRNAMVIWRDLVDDHGFPARYATVRRFVATLRGQQGAAGHRAAPLAPPLPPELQPFLTIESFHALVVHRPTLALQQHKEPQPMRTWRRTVTAATAWRLSCAERARRARNPAWTYQTGAVKRRVLRPRHRSAKMEKQKTDTTSGGSR